MELSNKLNSCLIEQTMSKRIKVGQLKLEIYPEMISAASKIKKLEIFSIWLILKTIDKHKQSTGKFQYSTILELFEQVLKVNKTYTYQLFNKGVGIFWNAPVGAKGNKIVYLYGIDKVLDKMPFDLAKTFPFYIKIEDLFCHENTTQLKTFLCEFVIARYGQNKPVSKSSLQDNLGLSKSSIKRRIRNSIFLNKKENYCFFENQFNNLIDAMNFADKIKKTILFNKNSVKVIKRNNIFYISYQVGNSYSLDEFSRGRISKRPHKFKVIDSINKDTYQRKKYHYTKIKNMTNTNLMIAKIKSNNFNHHNWKVVNVDKVDVEHLSEDFSRFSKTKSYRVAKRLVKINQE